MKRLGLVLACLPIAAYAAGCPPPKLENQVPITAIPVGDSQVEAVPVSLNGAETDFILDTGGILTQISPVLAEKLNLPINRTGSALVDVTGRQAAGLTMIRDFKLGAQTRHDVPLPVSPDSVVPTGLIALNDLTPYDADMDFAGNVLKFYASDHCPGVTAAAANAAPIPFRIEGGHILVTAVLDGKELPAILDTGSTGTDLRADVAKNLFGLVPGGPETPENGPLEGVAGLATYRHVFKNLGFGGIAISNPRVTIIPDQDSDAHPLGGPELIIGMDVLKTQHLYFAFGEGKFYVANPPLPPSP